MLARLSDVTNNFFSQNDAIFHIHRNHLIPYYPKQPLLYPHLCNVMRFSDSISLDTPKTIKYANSGILR